MKSFEFNVNENEEQRREALESGAVEILKSVENCLKSSDSDFHNDLERPDVMGPSDRLTVSIHTWEILSKAFMF